MKILLIGDVHNGISSESTNLPGHFKQGNDKAVDTLTNLLPKINNDIQPDVVFQMGDLIRDSHEKNLDEKHLLDILALFSKINPSTHHLLGNHDLLAFSKNELEDHLRQTSNKSDLVGMFTSNNIQFVWIDFDFDEDGYAILSDKSKEVLSSLKKNVPTIVLSHYSVVDWKAENNYYFKDNPTALRYKDSDEIFDLLSDVNVKLFINAHGHWGGVNLSKGIPVVVLPAFSDSITVKNHPVENPGVHSILTIENKSVNFQSFSGDYAFLNFQLKI